MDKQQAPLGGAAGAKFAKAGISVLDADQLS